MNEPIGKPTPVLECRGLAKTYVTGPLEVPVLLGIDLAIARGERVAIVGASGSGKSTLLNLLGCLDRPSSGQYVIAGNDVSQLDDEALSRIRSRYIGFIFQSYNLLPQYTVTENIGAALAPTEEGRREIVALARLIDGAYGDFASTARIASIHCAIPAAPPSSPDKKNP